MKSIETQKLGYVAYPVIIGEIQNLAESLIDLSDEDFSSRRESLLKTEGIVVNRFPIGGKPDTISIKIYNKSKYISLIETVRNLESYESDEDKFYKTLTTEFQNYIKESKHKLVLANIAYNSEISVDMYYLAEKNGIADKQVFYDYDEPRDENGQYDSKNTGGLIFTFEFVDEITILALHDYHWIFDKWDSASEEDKEKSLDNPINSKTHPGFFIHYPQISNVVKDGVDFISVKFEYFDPVIAIPQAFHTPDQDINAIYESQIIFNRVKAFFDKNITAYDNKKEITDTIREKYIGVFRQFGKNLLFLTKHYKIDYEARSYAEMIFTC